MKLKYNNIFIALIITILFSACAKDEQTTIFLSSSKGLNTVSNPGRSVEFIINIKSDKAIRNFKVSSKEKEKPTVLLLDSILQVPIKSPSFEFYFNVPISYDTTSYTLTFEAIDVDGNKGALLRQIASLPTSNLLPEFTGYFLYAKGGDELGTGFDLIKQQSLSLGLSVDSLIDIYDTTSTNVLSRVWHSKRGGKFVKSNSFNYPAATNLLIREAFRSSLQSDFASNLQKDDIILYSYRDTQERYVAIKIVNITNEEGSSKNRYEFNIKVAN
jgi:hypothetical protein